MPVEVVVENQNIDPTEVSVIVMKSNNYVIDGASTSYKLTVQKKEKR